MQKHNTLCDKRKKLREYPYVVVRYMAALYGSRAVVFSETAESKAVNENALIVPLKSPPCCEGVLTEAARQALIKVVSEYVKSSGFRMCCVFSETDAVYCERDGSANPSAEVPSGGLVIEGKVNITSDDEGARN